MPRWKVLLLGAPLAVAIAIHNVPEGVAIALPVIRLQAVKTMRLGQLVSGLAEPFGAALGYFILAPYMSETVYGLIFGVIGG